MTTAPPRLLSLAEVAGRLHMKRSNTAKYLARHGVAPAFAKAQGYFYNEDQIEQLRVAREANKQQMAADAKRRASQLRNHHGSALGALTGEQNLGPSERRVLAGLLTRPQLQDAKDRHAARRLSQRGLVERVQGELQTYRLTDRGREVAGQL